MNRNPFNFKGKEASTALPKSSFSPKTCKIMIMTTMKKKKPVKPRVHNSMQIKLERAKPVNPPSKGAPGLIHCGPEAALGAEMRSGGGAGGGEKEREGGEVRESPVDWRRRYQ